MDSCPHCGEVLPYVKDAFCPNCRQPLAAEIDGENERRMAAQTTIIDVPRPSKTLTAGVLIALMGLLLRSFARWLAWPSEWRYSGDRANTEWAYRESLYVDLGVVMLAFGLALVFLVIVKAHFQTANRFDAKSS